MSRNSKHRRDARKKKQARGDSSQSGSSTWGFDARRSRSDAPPSFDAVDHAAQFNRALTDAVIFGFGPSKDAKRFRGAVTEVADHSAFLEWTDLESALGQRVDSSTRIAFENGWQPAELMHVAARDLGTIEQRLVIFAIGSHAVAHSAYAHAPEAWIDQLTDLHLDADAPRGVEAVRHWMTTEYLVPFDCWEPVARVFSWLSNLVTLDALLTVPSKWGTRPSRRATPHPAATRTADTKILNRIRGLLAKAEASDFPEEAETLSAKAQDLMTQYTIDSAMLDADGSDDPRSKVVTRRILLTTPYPDAKLSLLNAVGINNGVKTLWHKEVGLASVVGMPIDLNLCELLFTSLLVQSTRALHEVGVDRETRTPSFRRSFLISYAHRISERLAEARERAAAAASSKYGKELVPVLAERAEAIADVFDRQFPNVRSVRSSVTNDLGWYAGRQAADTADLTGGRDAIEEDAS
ncbi:DUF2786 domain-containing protein [Gordonia sp. TBRC 11910]|uniref:DUF2786 domain-containing protein n=1 Tax=Gordonia asplenii TaxID=2725283 RepID=A0A848KWL8_9ACTN|nr:DUF2786 domain-containing protein [Gordonia asplenii]NMN99857.1 DUF2786 domain-containing protein [Gordonia asplenii]